eukprot:4358876-Prymnesium_polylepis.1
MTRWACAKRWRSRAKCASRSSARRCGRPTARRAALSGMSGRRTTISTRRCGARSSPCECRRHTNSRGAPLSKAGDCPRQCRERAVRPRALRSLSRAFSPEGMAGDGDDTEAGFTVRACA